MPSILLRAVHGWYCHPWPVSLDWMAGHVTSVVRVFVLLPFLVPFGPPDILVVSLIVTILVTRDRLMQILY
jgi:hypothetical protein